MGELTGANWPEPLLINRGRNLKAPNKPKELGGGLPQGGGEKPPTEICWEKTGAKKGAKNPTPKSRA